MGREAGGGFQGCYLHCGLPRKKIKCYQNRGGCSYFYPAEGGEENPLVQGNPRPLAATAGLPTHTPSFHSSHSLPPLSLVLPHPTCFAMSVWAQYGMVLGHTKLYCLPTVMGSSSGIVSLGLDNRKPSLISLWWLLCMQFGFILLLHLMCSLMFHHISCVLLFCK